VNHDFKPSSKSGRNRYAGSWEETSWREIALRLNASNLNALLEQAAGLLPTDYTHQDIAHWCDRYMMAAHMGEFRESANPADRKAARIAGDVSAQWDLFLANSFSLPQLQALNFSEVRLPSEWFRDWLKRINELGTPGET
jgi:hypothetical protein